MTSSASPYARAMLDYWQGNADAAYSIHRGDGFSHLVSVAASFAGPPFSQVDQFAMDRCLGSILDVGAGVGRHTLFLQGRECQITALEREPELVRIMSERGVREPLGGDVFSLGGRRFDTLLMLMNGFGLVGTPSGAVSFFQHARGLLSRNGQILCDSLDVRTTTNPIHLAYQDENLRRGRPVGQMRFWIEYQGRRGEPFDWLHMDFEGLRDLARVHGFSAELLAREDNGHYLACLAPFSP